MADIPENIQHARTERVFIVWLVAIVLLLDLFVVTVALVSLRQSRLQHQSSARTETENLSQALEFSIGGMLDTTDIALLALVDEMERAESRGGFDGGAMQSFLVRQHRRLPQLDGMRMVDADGKILFGTGSTSGAGISVADRDFFMELRDNPAAGLAISKPHFGRISKKWVLITGRRVNRPDGTFGGIVYGTIALEELRRIISPFNVGSGGAITLRDHEMGFIVGHSKPRGLERPAEAQPAAPELESRFAAGERRGTFYSLNGSGSIRQVISFRGVGRYPLYVTVGLAASDYLAPWWLDLYRMTALVALFVIVTLLLSRLIYVRWRREKQAEIALIASKEELELRVAERTAELFRSNSSLTRELAERERAEEKVRQGRNTLAQIIDSIPQSVFWKDRDSVYLGCNIVFARRAGLDTSEGVIGKSDYDLPWLSEESDAYRLDDQEVMTGRCPKYHIIEQQLQADGRRVWADTTKIPLFDRKGEVYGVVGVYDDISERKAIEEARDKALALFETLLESSPTGIQVFDGISGDCLVANQVLADMVGASRPQLLAQNYTTIASFKGSGILALAEQVLSDSVTRRVELSLMTTFGKSLYVDVFVSRCDVEGRPLLMVLGVDITETKRLEEENKRIEAQMLHVQKLESLGVLAGGIAHDFNNILMVVIGNADLALMRLEPESPAMENLVQIEQAANRAAELARQMLAYSGKGRLVIGNLDLTGIVQEMGQMLEVSISKKVALCYRFAPDLPAISGDATQLRQVILNLVINASEAIGDNRGTITIGTDCVHCDREYLSDFWIDDRLPEGKYVVVEVADTGCGMDREIIPKIFDPFFTTKFTGRGLGMAAVLGIVRGHKGAIKVYSEKGKGTSFRMLLPAVADAAEVQGAEASVDGLFKGEGTVLLVDDEESIRAVAENMLQALGFKVLCASEGGEGVGIFQRCREEIVCVLLDLTMPQLDGEETFRELRKIDPEARVIISSGYNEHEVSLKFAGQDRLRFIQKPFRLADVSRKFREILG